MQSRIFLDSGNPEDTKAIKTALGFLDGQTTNPSLVSKHPDLVAKKERGESVSQAQLLDFYKDIVQEISRSIPEGSVSIEVYADAKTAADEMFSQGKEFFSWIPNAHIKYPTTAAGLEAAERSIAEGMRVNMTLVFSQAQAAAVHIATKGAKKGDVFVSPFIGRLDDIGLNGMDLIKHCIRMYAEVGSHVEVLTASVRSLDHLYASLQLNSDIITIPKKILEAWIAAGAQQPGSDFVYSPEGLESIQYEECNLSGALSDLNIKHDLTDKGLEKFAADWNAVIQ